MYYFKLEKTCKQKSKRPITEQSSNYETKDEASNNKKT